MIIIWDCKTGRREFIEIALKSQNLEFYSCSEMSLEEIKLVKSLEPKLIITCSQFIETVKNDFTGIKSLELGKEIKLPLEPLSFLDQLNEELKCL